MLSKLTKLVTEFPKTTVVVFLIVTAFFAIQFPKMKIDTDPENMLREDEPIRVFHKQVKKEFGIEELIVLGIVRDDGIFHKDSLEKIRRITDEILKLKGVIADDVGIKEVWN